MIPTLARRAALALLALLAAGPAGAEDERGSGANGCAAAYHASLGRIRAAEYAALKGAGAVVAQVGDPGLPGTYLFPPQSRARSRAEIAALTAGTALVHSRGRSFGGGAEADRAWITARLREDLGDYLGQGPTPYLCSGVPAYLETLRGYAGRLGLSPDRRETLIATQTAAARKALTNAHAALAARTPPAPPAPAEALRPAAGLEREGTAAASGSTPTASAQATQAPASADATATLRAAGSAPQAVQGTPTPETAAAPASTPDAAVASHFPASAPSSSSSVTAPAETPLATSEDIAAAARALLDATERAGLLSAPLDPVATGGAPGAAYPALQAIALAKPGLAGRAPLVADAKLRRVLATTFSELEVLDYLLRSRALAADPTASAIEATLTAIQTAHTTDCTCGN